MVEVIEPDVYASIPAASLANIGSIYYATDRECTYQCVKTAAGTYAWRNITGRTTKRYTSADLTGWTAVNGSGAATIDNGFKLALLTAQSSSAAYPDASSPRYYRDISSDIAGSDDFTIWVRIKAASGLDSDRLGGIALNDTTEATGTGACALTGGALQLTAVPFLNGEYVGAPAAVTASDGTGWLGFSRRGGSWASLAGIGTTTEPPTNYASCRIGVGGSTGQGKPTRLSLYAQKFGGTDMSVTFEDIVIYCY